MPQVIPRSLYGGRVLHDRLTVTSSHPSRKHNAAAVCRFALLLCSTLAVAALATAEAAPDASSETASEAASETALEADGQAQDLATDVPTGATADIADESAVDPLEPPNGVNGTDLDPAGEANDEDESLDDAAEATAQTDIPSPPGPSDRSERSDQDSTELAIEYDATLNDTTLDDATLDDENPLLGTVEALERAEAAAPQTPVEAAEEEADLQDDPQVVPEENASRPELDDSGLITVSDYERATGKIGFVPTEQIEVNKAVRFPVDI
jgi:hypothetical protein